jgi:hypothetical protein
MTGRIYATDTVVQSSLTRSVRNAWGVTPIDAISTAIIMGESDIVSQILDFVPQIDFTTTAEADSAISLFETNIRFLAGLISGIVAPGFVSECC